MLKKAIVAVAAAVVIAVALRIAWVNAHAVVLDTEHYAMGEWVDLSGCYFDTLDAEDYSGYFVRVNSAKAVSYKEFLESYAKSTPSEDTVTAGKEETIVVTADEEEKDIVVLELEVRNEGNENGAMALYRYNLVPARKNVAYTHDADLWSLVEPQLGENVYGISLAPDSSYTTYLPFTYVDNPPYLQKYDREIRMPVADDRSFELTLCNAPAQKIIDIEIES